MELNVDKKRIELRSLTVLDKTSVMFACVTSEARRNFGCFIT